MPESSAVPRLLYVADAMCSWCWGFAPSLDALLARNPALPVLVLPGGLRPGAAAQRLGDGLAGYLAGAWREVARRSGQPFSWSLLERADFLYDTDPPARALTAYASLSVGPPYPFFRALQAAFYAQGRDITRDEELIDLAAEQGAEREAFAAQLRLEVTAQETRAGYQQVREMGLRGFPALFLESGAVRLALARGWVAPEALLAAYERSAAWA